MLQQTHNFASPYPQKPWNLDTQVASTISPRGIERDGLYVSALPLGQPQEQASRRLPMQPMPCPLRCWTSLANIFVFSGDQTIRDAEWNQVPDGLYAIPCGHRVTAAGSMSSTGTNSAEGALFGGWAFRVTLTGPFPSGGTITVAIGGTNGYTVTRPVPIYNGAWSEVFFTPTPYDDGESRSLAVSWTGTASGSASVAEYYQSYAIIPAELPEGWTPVPSSWAHEHGDASSAAYNGSPWASIREYWNAADMYALHWLSGSPDYITYKSDSRIGNMANASVTEAQLNPPPEVSTGWKFYRFRAYSGRPMWDGTQYRRSTHDAGVWRGIGTFTDGVEFGSPRITEMFLAMYQPASAEMEVVVAEGGPNANGDWIPTYLATELDSGTWYHGGTGWETFAIDLSYPYDPDGYGWDAKISFTVADNDVVGLRVAKYDPQPLPYALSATDGTAIPGGYFPESSPVARGPQIVAVSYPSFVYSDIPSDQQPWAVRFDDVPEGYYVLRTYDVADAVMVTTPLWGEDEATPLAGITIRHGHLCKKGRLFWAPSTMLYTIGTANFGNGRASSPQWNRSTLIPIPVAHKTFSVGSNTIRSSTSDWGLTFPYTPTAAERHFAFAKFTAPAAGTYRITHDRAVREDGPRSSPAMWVSTTDQYCAHYRPDLRDPEHPIWANSLIVYSSPPTPGSTPQIRRGIIVGGTGVWEGLDGWMATGVDPGVGSGGTIDWRLTNPPDGTLVFAGAFYLKVGGLWVLESSVLPSIDVVLAEGQTLWMRLGYIERPSHTTYGSGYRVGTPGATTVTIAAL